MDEISTQEFIQDFLEESAEHLQSIKRNLLALEDSLSAGVAPEEAVITRVGFISELFRSYHTIKGLAGMIGLGPAEELSHAMETVLRAIQKMEIEPTPSVIDGLLQGTRTLEHVIATVAAPGSESPQAVDGDLALLSGLLAGGAAPSPSSGILSLDETSPVRDEIPLPEVAAGLTPLENQQLQAARAAGKVLSLAIFAPDAEKSRQGQNVNMIREQFRQAGELIKAMPLIQGSLIRFAFLVASPLALDPADFPEMEWIELDSNGDLQGRDGEPPLTPEPVLPAGAPLQATSPTVRVSLERLDDLIYLVGDLVVARYRVSEIVPELAGASPLALEALEQSLVRMERSLRDLRQAVISARMVPLSEVFNHMPLAVRELARVSGKEIRLVVEGENTEVDRTIVEQLLDPILHLVRNAVTHGIEPPIERLAAGKPAQGVITLRAAPEGDRIRISVCDNGRGIDPEELSAKATAMGWLNPQQAGAGDQALSEAEMLDLICQPGFSTKGQVDLGAGRGVGMDVVRKMVTSTGGSLSLSTKPGLGTTFTLHLPLTLTTFDALLVRCGKERFAIPRRDVEGVLEIDPSQILEIESGEIYPYRQDSLTLVRLSRLFHLPSGKPPLFLCGLVSPAGEGRTALVVDQLLGLREIVARPLRDPLVTRPGTTGATEMGDGSIVLILDLKALIEKGIR